MQSVSSRIWTCVTVSISYDDNYYTTGINNQKIFFRDLLTYLLHIYTYMVRMWHKVKFKAKFDKFEFRLFLLLDWLPYQSWRALSTLLFVHSSKENHWIHFFPKGISIIWNTNSLVQVLNSGCHVHIWWQPLHHRHLHIYCMYASKNCLSAQSAGVIEYIECIFAEG